MGKTKYEKTAKDIAFDKERGKLNKKIRELEFQLKNKELEIRTLKESHEKENRELEELRDWNRRLLEYMDLSEEDMRNLLRKEKTEHEILSIFSEMGKILNAYGVRA